MKIHQYAMNGNIKALRKEICKEGIQIIDSQDSLWARTPIHLAVSYGHLEVVKVLFSLAKKHDYPIDIYTKDAQKATILHSAVMAVEEANNEKQQKSALRIFKLLLTEERKLRLEYPQAYQDKPLLKDIKSQLGFTPLGLLSKDSSALRNKLEKIISKMGTTDRYKFLNQHGNSLYRVRNRKFYIKNNIEPSPQTLFVPQSTRRFEERQPLVSHIKQT